MKKAFTIVEVILVLSISSLFAVGMMVGWNVNIERQRYNDTVNTLKSDIQGIFNEVENPTNATQGAIRCRDNGGGLLMIEDLATSTGENRGTTNCILLGKSVDMRGDIINVADIIGEDINISTACGGVCDNHIEALRASKMSFRTGSPNSREVQIQWNNNISARGSDSRSFIVVRSPLDNTLLAFSYNDGMVAGDGTAASFNINNLRNDFLSADRLLSDSRKIGVCINSENNPFGGQSKLMLIGGTAASVEIAPLNDGGC